MEREKTINIGPICRFGPGGEYISVWPAGGELACPRMSLSGVESVDLINPAERPKNALAGLLNVLAGMIDALLGNSNTHPSALKLRRTGGKPYYVSSDFAKATPDKEDRNGADAAAGPVVKDNRLASEQRWLFADDWRAGRTAKYKPNHRIRAYRAVAKKRSYIALAESGSLFDADCEVARTA
jgi:hypothetical protein